MKNLYNDLTCLSLSVCLVWSTLALHTWMIWMNEYSVDLFTNVLNVTYSKTYIVTKTRNLDTCCKPIEQFRNYHGNFPLQKKLPVTSKSENTNGQLSMP